MKFGAVAFVGFFLTVMWVAGSYFGAHLVMWIFDENHPAKVALLVNLMLPFAMIFMLVILGITNGIIIFPKKSYKGGA